MPGDHGDQDEPPWGLLAILAALALLVAGGIAWGVISFIQSM
jgi:hypothetical protein